MSLQSPKLAKLNVVCYLHSSSARKHCSWKHWRNFALQRLYLGSCLLDLLWRSWSQMFLSVLFSIALFYLSDSVIGCRCVWVIAGGPGELIGCCLEARSLSSSSSQFLQALFFCPRLPTCVTVYTLCLWIKLFKNISLLVVLGKQEEGSLTFRLHQGFH